MAVMIFWIENTNAGRLGIMPRPRGDDWLEDEVSSVRDSGVDVVVSLLEQEEISELGLENEQRLCENAGLTHISYPIPDRDVPQSMLKTAESVDKLAELSSQGRHIVVHCRQGIGRSSIIAAAILATQGITVEDAFDRMAKARGRPVPDTSEQREWVAKLVSTRLGR